MDKFFCLPNLVCFLFLLQRQITHAHWRICFIKYIRPEKSTSTIAFTGNFQYHQTLLLNLFKAFFTHELPMISKEWDRSNVRICSFTGAANIRRLSVCHVFIHFANTLVGFGKQWHCLHRRLKIPPFSVGDSSPPCIWKNGSNKKRDQSSFTTQLDDPTHVAYSSHFSLPGMCHSITRIIYF